MVACEEGITWLSGDETVTTVVSSGMNLNVYFKLRAEADVSEYKFTRREKAVTPVIYSAADNTCVLKVKNIHAKNLGTKYSFTVTKGDKSRELKYSAYHMHIQ